MNVAGRAFSNRQNTAHEAFRERLLLYCAAYYYYPENDQQPSAELADRFRTHYGEIEDLSQSVIDMSLIKGVSMFSVQSSPMMGLVVICPVSDEEEMRSLVQMWEDLAGPLTEMYLLGRSYALAGFSGPETVLAELEKGLQCQPPERGRVQIDYGPFYGLRRAWGYTGGLSISVFGEVSADLLFGKFPQMEMKWLRSQLIWQVNRDQRRTIESERVELERELSEVLFSTLRPTARHEQLDDLEKDIGTLSRGYGILTGNYRILMDGLGKHRELTAILAGEIGAGELALRNDTDQVVLLPLEQELEQLENLRYELKASQENFRAGMGVVDSKVEILLSRENLQLQHRVMDVMEIGNSMQRQSLTLQVSASLIEFVVVAYYGFNLWKGLDHVGYEIIPGWIQIVLVLLFAGDIVYLTHLMAEIGQGHREHVGKATAFLVIALLIIGFIVAARFIFSA